MGAITDLWKSERGFLAVLIIIAASVLAGLGKMTIDSWQTFVTGIFVAYATGKTITGTVAIIKGGADPALTPEPTPAPAPAPAPVTPTP
jgi:hypothetical protein